YRSAILVHDDDQKKVAIASRDRAQARFAKPIVTEVTPATTFWPAEEYHQRYYEKRGIDPTCHI
ncbi:MAG: peptide-methionine (S)-S-oxide reductase, partial [Vicinamibacterales bacterium]